MSDAPMNVEIGANVDPALAGLQKLSDAVGGLQGALTSQFGAIGNAIAGLKAPLVGVLAIVAGGGMFKHVIEETIAWNMEVRRLALVLGTGKEEASAWALRMKETGLGTDTLTQSLGMLTMRIANGSEAFDKYKINLEAAGGGLRAAGDIFMDIAKKANGMSNETQRNAMLASLLGRSWKEILPTIEALKGGMEGSREKVKHFGVEVNDTTVNQAKAFKVAVHEMGEATEALAINIGNRLIPMLTNLAQGLGKLGDDHFPKLMAFVDGFVLGLDAFWTAIKMILIGLEFMGRVIMRLIEGVGLLAIGLSKLVNLDWKGAGEAIEEGLLGTLLKARGELANSGADMERLLNGFATRFQETMDRAAGKKPLPHLGPPEAEKGGGGEMPDMSAAFMKKAQDAYTAFREKVYAPSVGEELEFWKRYEAIALAGGSKWHEAYRSIHEKVVGLAGKAQEQQLQMANAGAEQALIVGKHMAEERLAIETAAYQRTVEMYGMATPQAQAAWGKVLEAQQAVAEQERAIAELRISTQEQASLRMIEVRQNELAIMRDLGMGDASAIIAEMQSLEAQKTEALLQGLRERQLLYKDDVIKRGEIANQIAQVEAEGYQKQRQLQKEAFQAMAQQAQTLLTPMQNAFQSIADGIIEGALDMKKILTSLWQSLAKTIIGELLRIMMQRTALAITEAMVGKASAISQVSQNAAIGATAAAASVASVPFAGPALAAAAYAGTLGLLLGALPLASAAGGWDLGRESPIAQLHANEMVLPAHLAEKVRNMADGGGGPTQVTVHVNVQGAIDGQSVYRVFKDNESMILKSLVEAKQNGRW